MAKTNLEEYFQPFHSSENYEPGQFGAIIKQWNRKSLQNIDVAVIGISELNSGTEGSNLVRNYLYSLFCSAKKVRIVDFGDVVSASSEDMVCVVEDVAKELSNNDITAVFLGNGSLNPAVIPKVQLNIKQPVDWATISPSLTQFNRKFVSAQSKQDWFRFLFGLGSQAYFDNSAEIADNDQLYVENLGKIRDDISSVEPVFRMVQYCSFDLNSIRSSDFNATNEKMPNGFYNEEICKLAWYAGNSSTILSYYLFGYSFENDKSGNGAMLYSQVVWHIINGILNRVDETPQKSTKGFKEYYVESKLFDEHIVFYQSRRTNRFWCKIPVFNHYIPCRKRDMDAILQGEIPEIIYRFMKVL